VHDRFQPSVFLTSTQCMIEETADDEPSDNENDDVDESRNSEGQDVAWHVTNPGLFPDERTPNATGKAAN
jgi:hypothetical protein